MRWDVETERDFDGVRILKRHVGEDGRGLTAADVMALKFEEQCLPGELIRFEKTKHDVVARGMRLA